MIDKNHLSTVNNYCKTVHTMTERGKAKASFDVVYFAYLNCLEGDLFKIDKINPQFMYNKWLTKE